MIYRSWVYVLLTYDSFRSQMNFNIYFCSHDCIRMLSIFIYGKRYNITLLLCMQVHMIVLLYFYFFKQKDYWNKTCTKENLNWKSIIFCFGCYCIEYRCNDKILRNDIDIKIEGLSGPIQPIIVKYEKKIPFQSE